MTGASFSGPGAQVETAEGYGEMPNLMVLATSGSPSWIVVLRGSPDGQNWTTMITHSSSLNASGETVFAGAERFPCGYRQIYCVSCTGGTIYCKEWAN